MVKAQKERRSDKRFHVSLPVMVRPANGRSLPARTRDISQRGICLYLPSELTVGSEIDFVVTLPAEVTLTAPMRVKGTGRIVRAEKSSGGAGVGAVIRNYRFTGE